MNPAKKTGSVIGVACKYRRFGLRANIPRATNAEADDRMARRTAANKKAPASTKQADDGIAPARPLRSEGSYRTKISVNAVGSRSEEHTSELQSLRHLVC